MRAAGDDHLRPSAAASYQEPVFGTWLRVLERLRRCAGSVGSPLRCSMAASIAVLKLSKRVKNVITFAQNVATAMTNNPAFPTPNPPLSTFQSDVAALNPAETAVLSRGKGAVENRNAKLAVVRSDLDNLRT